jgi:hypothetical protein
MSSCFIKPYKGVQYTTITEMYRRFTYVVTYTFCQNDMALHLKKNIRIYYLKWDSYSILNNISEFV